jgi:predicted phage baseplate assembly protein
VALVSLFAAGPVTVESVAPPDNSPFAWEYRSPSGWSELAVLDETGGFAQTGMVQFIGPPDLTADAGPDGPLYWVRARLKVASGDPNPLALQALYLNAVWATNRTTVSGETLGPADGSASLLITVQHPPVLAGQLVEVQEWSGSGDSWQSLLDDVPAGDLRQDTDANGNVTAVWVTWHEQPHLYSSGPRDRHYTIQRAQGALRFGDASAGMIPPPGAAVAVSYDYGGGREGNVAAGTITQLQSAVPYVASIANPLPASGGSDAEALPTLDPASAATFTPPTAAWRDGVRGRGPQQLRHRGRSLAPSDYEWLARDASTEVALTRCLPATGPDGRQPGWVTVVVAPVGSDTQPEPSLGLLDTVRTHLASCAPAAIAAQIRVIGPAYEPISVFGDIVVADAGVAAAVEQDLRAALDAYLHPVLGGGQRGWRFGDTVHLSPIARLIEAVPGVGAVKQLQLSVGSYVHGDSVAVQRDHLPASGRHTLRLEVTG